MIRVVSNPVSPVTPKPKPSPEEKEVELKYDDGGAEGSASVGAAGGFRVSFSPPATPITIRAVKLFSSLNGSGFETQTTQLKILDKQLKVLHSVQKPASEFSRDRSWVTIDIPGVVADGDFYVCFYPNSKAQGGVYLSFDSGSANQHSEYVTPTGDVAQWVFTPPKDRTNWMIRVLGTVGG
jgi:hypothetical protein